MTLSNNNEDTPIMDMISEQKTGMTPAYDMPQAYDTTAPRLIEADYKPPSSGAWWYDGSNSTVDYGLNIGRYIANTGNTVLSLMAETPQVNGKFPSNQATFNNFWQTYRPPIWESVGGTYGGGYMYGGMPGISFGNGAPRLHDDQQRHRQDAAHRREVDGQCVRDSHYQHAYHVPGGGVR